MEHERRFVRFGEDGTFRIFAGKNGGDMRVYKTLDRLDKEMTKLGYKKHIFLRRVNEEDIIYYQK